MVINNQQGQQRLVVSLLQGFYDLGGFQKQFNKVYISRFFCLVYVAFLAFHTHIFHVVSLRLDRCYVFVFQATHLKKTVWRCLKSSAVQLLPGWTKNMGLKPPMMGSCTETWLIFPKLEDCTNLSSGFGFWRSQWCLLSKIHCLVDFPK